MTTKIKLYFDVKSRKIYDEDRRRYSFDHAKEICDEGKAVPADKYCRLLVRANFNFKFYEDLIRGW